MSATNPMKNNLVTLIGDRLKQDGFNLRDDTIGQFDVLVGESRQFKVSWFATQLNIFVIITSLEEVTREIITSFSTAALEYAIKNNSGLPRGLQSGVACFELIISPSISDDAKAWVQKKSRKRFAAFAVPVLLDSNDNTLMYYKKTPILGGLYYKFFRKFVEKYFTI